MTNYLTTQQFRSAKTRLTKAVKSGDHRKVIATVNATFAEWDAGDYAYPDNWHDWDRAKMDAEMALRYA